MIAPITVAEAAARWGWGIKSVESYCRLGRIDAQKVGSAWQIWQEGPPPRIEQERPKEKRGKYH